MRDDRNAVQDMLFAAFEKHQYYNIRDLVKITRQPIVNIYLLFILFSHTIFKYIIAEILTLCIFNIFHTYYILGLFKRNPQ